MDSCWLRCCKPRPCWVIEGDEPWQPETRAKLAYRLIYCCHLRVKTQGLGCAKKSKPWPWGRSACSQRPGICAQRGQKCSFRFASNKEQCVDLLPICSLDTCSKAPSAIHLRELVDQLLAPRKPRENSAGEMAHSRQKKHQLQPLALHDMLPRFLEVMTLPLHAFLPCCWPAFCNDAH